MPDAVMYGFLRHYTIQQSNQEIQQHQKHAHAKSKKKLRVVRGYRFEGPKRWCCLSRSDGRRNVARGLAIAVASKRGHKKGAFEVCRICRFLQRCSVPRRRFRGHSLCRVMPRSPYIQSNDTCRSSSINRKTQYETFRVQYDARIDANNSAH